MSKTERRFAIDGWQAADFQIRADGDGMTFHGYAAIFNADSEPLPHWGVERIAPGAFTKSLGEQRNIRMFVNHNPDSVLASTKSGTLRLAEDDTGLQVEAELPDTSSGRDLAVLLERGDVDSMSFGFTPVKFAKRDDGTDGYIHSEVRLWEVSPVTSWPAYAATSAFVRHLAEATGLDPDDIAELLSTADRSVEQGAEFTDEQFDRWILVGNRLRGQRVTIGHPELVAITSKVSAHQAEVAAMEKLLGRAN